MKYYTGIGSRNIPSTYGERMFRICEQLAKKGYVLRSGGARGADTYAEMGCDEGKGKKEIYLPHKGFNNSDGIVFSDLEFDVVQKAASMAREIHPNWKACSPFAQLAHSRNICQILGRDLKTPSEFVVCYTDDGTAKGGTATAMNLAKRLGIPVYNLYHDGVETFLNFL